MRKYAGESPVFFSSLNELLSLIMLKKGTRNLGLFCGLLTVFSAIQGIYAFRVDSLGLLSDSFHMFFHCAALATSLASILIARRPPAAAYSYGFERFEVLAAFANSLFLIFLVAFVAAGALQRLLQPATFNTDTLLSLEFGIIGLFIQVWGMIAIRPGALSVAQLVKGLLSGVDQSSGWGGAGFAASDDGEDGNEAIATGGGGGTATPAAPSRPSSAAGASFRALEEGRLPSSSGSTRNISYKLSGAGGGGAGSSATFRSGHDSNLYSLYVTFWTDALSSLAVIGTSMLIRYGGWAWVDAAQSLLVSGITLYSVLPLFKNASTLLLQATPHHLLAALEQARREVAILEGVLEVGEEHFWAQAQGNVVGTIHLRARSDAPAGSIQRKVRAIYGRYVNDLTIQVEKDASLKDLVAPVGVFVHQAGSGGGGATTSSSASALQMSASVLSNATPNDHSSCATAGHSHSHDSAAASSHHGHSHGSGETCSH